MAARPRWVGIAIAVAGVALATFTRSLLDPVFAEGGGVFTFYYLAIVAAAAYGGLGGGLLATGLSALLGEYLFMPPRYELVPQHVFGAVQLGSFVVIGATISVLCRSLHRARERAARALVEVSELSGDLGAAVRVAELGIWQFDPARGLVRLDARCRELIGLPPDHPGLTPAQLVALVHPEDRARAREYARARAAFSDQSRTPELECRIVRTDGTIRSVLVRAAIDHARGHAAHGTVLDDTDRRTAADELRRNEALLAAMLEAAPLGVYVVDASGGVIRINRAAREMWGSPPLPSSWRGYESYRGFDPATGRRLAASEWAMARAVRSGETIAGELVECERFDDGQRFFLLNSAAAIRDAEGRISGAVAMMLDVTRQRLAEMERDRLLDSERAARREAETASRAKDEFLATASHELRTPLNAILGWVSLLRNDPRVTTIPEATQGLEVIHRNARAQAQLIEDILDVSRIVTGQLTLHVQRVELRPILEAALDTVRVSAIAKGVSLRYEPEPMPPVWVDPDRMQQVVWNLLSNAVKFTERGGAVTVRTQREDTKVVISVRDTGQGIDTLFLPHVFERFRMADASTTRRHGGLGLGLAIVRHLVEAHGGTVRAESPGPGRGSTFSIELPDIARSETGAAPAAAPATDEGPHVEALRGIKALVLDDDDDARRFVGAALERCGVAVVSASSVREAMGHLENGTRPDVVISDIGMPDEDGLTFVARLRGWERAHGVHVPAMALSAYARLEDRARAILAGYDAYVAKPIEATELVSQVADLAARDARDASPTSQ